MRGVAAVGVVGLAVMGFTWTGLAQTTTAPKRPGTTSFAETSRLTPGANNVPGTAVIVGPRFTNFGTGRNIYMFNSYGQYGGYAPYAMPYGQINAFQGGTVVLPQLTGGSYL